jgi:hypothetical protein
MLALTLGQAKNIALAAVVVLALGAVASAWVMKTIMQKLALVLILGLLAVLAWTQRSSVDECADKVRAGGLQGVDTTCSFFGREVTVDTTRS